MGYGLDDRGVRVQTKSGNVSLYHSVETGFGAHPASYAVGIRGSFPGVKWPEREAEHSPPSSAKVKNAWSCTSTLPIPALGPTQPPIQWVTWALFVESKVAGA
jgi:hypothetical protein